MSRVTLNSATKTLHSHTHPFRFRFQYNKITFKMKTKYRILIVTIPLTCILRFTAGIFVAWILFMALDRFIKCNHSDALHKSDLLGNLPVSRTFIIGCKYCWGIFQLIMMRCSMCAMRIEIFASDCAMHNSLREH